TATVTGVREITIPRLSDESVARLNDAVRQSGTSVAGLAEAARSLGAGLSRAFANAAFMERSPEIIRPRTIEAAASVIRAAKAGNGPRYSYLGIQLSDFPDIRLTGIDDDTYDDSRQL